MLYEKTSGFGKIDRETAPDKRDTNTFFDVVNFDTYFTDRGMSIKASKGLGAVNTINGDDLPLSVSSSVIGDCEIEDRLFIFTTRTNLRGGNYTPVAVYDAIMEIVDDNNGTGDIVINVIKSGDFNFDVKHPIKAIGNKETDEIVKIYFFDGINQARFINVEDPEDNLDFVAANELVGQINGEQYTGTTTKNMMVRYAYQLYNQNGASSKLSGWTEPIRISEEANQLAQVFVTDLSDNYTNVRIYRLSYETLDGLPSLNIILERNYTPNSNSFNFVDDGNMFVSAAALENLYTIGSDLIKPYTATVKKETLLLGNFKSEAFIMNEGLSEFQPLVGMRLDGGAYMDLGLVPMLNATGTSYVELDYSLIDTASFKAPFGWNTGFIYDSFYIETSTGYRYTTQTNPLSASLGPKPLGMTKFRCIEYRDDIGGWETDSFINGATTYEQNFFTPTEFSSVPFYVGGRNNDGILTGSCDMIIINAKFYNGVTFKEYNDANNWSDAINYGGVKVYSYDGGITWQETEQPPEDIYPSPGYWDPRAYGHNSSGDIVLKDIDGTSTVFPTYVSVPINHDCITDNKLNYYHADGTTIGLEGPNLKISITGNTLTTPVEKRKYKQGEIYRIGIELQDEFMRWSQAMWVGDMYIPYLGDFASVVATIKTAPDPNIHGNIRAFKLVMIERTTQNKTVVAQGVPQPIMRFGRRAFPNASYIGGSYTNMGFPNMKTIQYMASPTGGDEQPNAEQAFEIGRPFNYSGVRYGDGSGGFGEFTAGFPYDYPFYKGATPPEMLITEESHNYQTLITPETALYKVDLEVTDMKILGTRTSSSLGSFINVRDDNGGSGHDNWQAFNTNLPSGNPVTRYVDSGGLPTNGAPAGNAYVPDSIFDDFHYHASNVDHNNKIRAFYSYYRGTGNLLRYVDNPDNSSNNRPVAEFKYVGFYDTITIDSVVLANSPNQAIYTESSRTSDQYNSTAGYSGEGCEKFFMRIGDSNWSGLRILDEDVLYGQSFSTGSPTLSPRYFYPYTDFFPSSAPIAQGDQMLPIVDMIRINANQYGGGSYEVKSQGIYIDASETFHMADNAQAGMFGDIYVGEFKVPFNTGATYADTNAYNTMFDYFSMILESSVSPEEFNYKMMEKSNVSADQYNFYKNLTSQNLTDYNTVFSQAMNVVLGAGRPYNYTSIVDNYARIVPSSTKIRGELVDSWTEILTGTYIDLLGIHGPIRELLLANDRVMAFQERAIAVVSVYPVNQVAGTTGQIQLGKGTVLDDYTYVKTGIGALSKETVKEIEGMVFFIDGYNKTLSTLTEGNVSTLGGFKEYTAENLHLPYTANGAGPDPIYGNENMPFVFIDQSRFEVGFKFNRSLPVLIYNYATKAFTHRRTYNNSTWIIAKDTNLYICYPEIDFTANAQGKIYKAYMGDVGNYPILDLADTDKRSVLELWTNPAPGMDKVFDAVELMTQGQSQFDAIEVNSYTRTSGEQSAGFKEKFDIHTAHLPRVSGGRNRWREAHVKIKLLYSAATEFIVDMFKVKFTLKK